jgi:hypothetical protein
MDPDLINMIQFLVSEIYRFKNLPQNSYTTKLLNDYRRKLAQFRSVAVYYREWSSIENIELLGKKYIAQMKRDLPPLVFQPALMCIRRASSGGFYPAFRRTSTFTRHTTTATCPLDYDLQKAAVQDSRRMGIGPQQNHLCGL